MHSISNRNFEIHIFALLTFREKFQDVTQALFVSTGSIPIGMDKYNKKIMIVTIRDSDLFRVEN
jgi:hypothetical protein